MSLEPYWGVVIGLGLGVLIKTFLGRRSRKAAADGRCPDCGSELLNKPFTTVTLRVCPHKHGYLSGDDCWVEAAHIERTTRNFRHLDPEDVPQQLILYQTMYEVLFSDGPVDLSPVDNVPRRPGRTS